MNVIFFVVLFIKNKTIIIMVLFLMKIAKMLRLGGMRLYVDGKIGNKKIKLILNWAHIIHRFSLKLLRIVKVSTLK